MTSTCHTIAIVQARMGSSRMPRKVLEPVLGRPLLDYLVERLNRARTLEGVVIATTVEQRDDVIADFCGRHGVSCFRGSENDVLDRYYQAAKSASADVIVRITADCPLIDPAIVDGVVRLRAEREADYAGNIEPPTFPDGMSVEAMTFAALETAWRDAPYKYQREHVTSYITEHPEKFRVANLAHPSDLSSLRITVDYPDDLLVVKAVFSHIAEKRIFGHLKEIVAYLQEHPEIVSLNGNHIRNESYDTSDK